MDAALVNKTRKFPSYTLAQLEASVSQFEAGTHPLQATTDEAHIEALKTEIAARKAGTSKPLIVPQFNGPMVLKTI